MKKSARLSSVVKIAESHEQSAAQALGESQQQLEGTQQQLALLMSYRDDYIAQLNRRAENGISISQMQSYRTFIAQLGKSIESQHSVIDKCEQNVEAKRQAWFAARRQTQAMDKVIAKYICQEQLLEAKQDQKESDDRSQLRCREMFAY